MALPSGQISFADINIEMGLPANTTIGLGQSDVRGLIGSSGEVVFNSLRGVSAIFALNLFSSNNVNLRNTAIAAGWNQRFAIVATIPAGNVIGSTSTASPALDIQGNFPRGVTIINAGSIIGAGGAGGAGVSGGVGGTGGAGGTALNASSPVNVNNLGTIGGGGGGGGAGGSTSYTVSSGKTSSTARSTGGGGGGGAGGGAGGSPNGATGSSGAGGGGGAGSPNYTQGGAGGGLGSAGSAGTGGNYTGPGGGGAGGAAVVGNGNVTWILPGLRFGSIL